MKKRVLYLTNIPSPYRVEFFNELAKYMDVTVTFELKNAKNRDEAWQSSENYKFNYFFMKPLIKRTETAYCPEVYKLVREFKNDIIVVGGYATPTGMAAILYMRAKKIPFFINCDGGFISDDGRLKKKVKTFFVGSANYYLSPGEGADKYLVYYGAKKENIFHYSFSSLREADIAYDICTNEEKLSIRQKLGINESHMIIFVGGSDLSPYHDIISDGVKCHIYSVGFKQKEEIKQYYRAADVMVLPTREDIWGLVVNEAMAEGLPVITTNHCLAGLSLVKNDENGYIVQVDDVEATKKAIGRVFEVDNVARFGRKSLEKIKGYTIEQMAREHREVFEEAYLRLNKV